DGATGKLAGDFRGRQIGDLDALHALDAAAIGAVVTDRRYCQTGALEDRCRILLDAALRRQGDGDRAHREALAVSMRSSQSEKPTAGLWSVAPSSVISRSYRPPPASTAEDPSCVTSKTRPV